MSPASAPDCYALLDDRNATEAHPLSRLYTGLVREHVCRDPAQLEAVWAAADADLRAGLHAVLLADYEWGARLLKAGNARLGPEDGALRVLMFASLRHLSRDQVDQWLAVQEARAEPGPAGVMNLQPSVDQPQFTQAIHHIHEAIRAGETYQVNYTYRLNGAGPRFAGGAVPPAACQAAGQLRRADRAARCTGRRCQRTDPCAVVLPRALHPPRRPGNSRPGR